MRLRYTPQARRDIAAIHDYIARDNRAAARRVTAAIRTRCRIAAKLPHAGVITDEPDVLRAPLGSYPYAIFYRTDAPADEVHVLAIVHGARVRDRGKLP